MIRCAFEVIRFGARARRDARRFYAGQHVRCASKVAPSWCPLQNVERRSTRSDFRSRAIASPLFEALVRGDAAVKFLHEPEADTEQDEHDDRRQQCLLGPNIFFLRGIGLGFIGDARGMRAV